MKVEAILALLLLAKHAELPEARPRWREQGLASIYGQPGDRHAGGRPACLRGARLPPPEVPFCAHRTLPCGSVLLVELARTGARALCVVIDRGPYGAIHDGSWVLKRRRSDPGRWRGVLDLSLGVAIRLGHRGLERVRLQPLSGAEIERLRRPQAHAKPEK